MATTGFRSYLAGTGASGSILLAGLVALVSVTAFVGFDAMPFGSGNSGAGTVSLQRPDNSGAAAATAAAAAVGGAPAAVAAAPATPAAPAAAAAAPGAAPGAAAAAPAPGAPGVTGVPGGGSATQTDIPTAPTPAAGGPTNPVDDVVAGLDQTVQGVTGTNPNLGGTTKPITSGLDQVIQGATGNTLGGHLDNLGLGQKP